MGRPYTISSVAWAYFMRGAELYRRFTPKDNAHARELFEKAIDLDPEFARAYANLAATHRQDWILTWTQDRDTSEELAYRLAHKAVELARRELEPKPSLPYALEQWGWVLLDRGRHQEAIDAAEEAVQRNPNYADGYALWAHVLSYLEEPEEALRKMEEAFRLNPNYPFLYDYHRGHAYYVWGFLTGEYDVEAARHYYQEAEKHLREALRRNNNYRPARSFLVAVLWELGRQEEAKQEMAIVREMGLPNAGARFYFAFEGEASRGTFVQYGANVDLIFDYAPPPADAALIEATGLDRARTLQVPLGIMVLPIGFTFRGEGDSGYRQMRFYQGGTTSDGDSGYRQMRFYQGGTTSDKVRFELQAMDEPSPEQSVKSRPSGDSLDTAPTTGFHVIFDLRSYVLYQFFLPVHLVRILPESEDGMPTPQPLTFDLDQLKQFDDHAVEAQERMAAALQKVLS